MVHKTSNNCTWWKCPQNQTDIVSYVSYHTGMYQNIFWASKWKWGDTMSLCWIIFPSGCPLCIDLRMRLQLAKVRSQCQSHNCMYQETHVANDVCFQHLLVYGIKTVCKNIFIMDDLCVKRLFVKSWGDSLMILISYVENKTGALNQCCRYRIWIIAYLLNISHHQYIDTGDWVVVVYWVNHRITQMSVLVFKYTWRI